MEVDPGLELEEAALGGVLVDGALLTPRLLAEEQQELLEQEPVTENGGSDG